VESTNFENVAATESVNTDVIHRLQCLCHEHVVKVGHWSLETVSHSANARISQTAKWRCH